MTRGEQAAANFKNGYNCAQALLLAFRDLTELDEKTAVKLSSGFGGGMGRLREVCGAANGAFMVISLLYGDVGIPSHESKAALYARIQDFAARFQAKNDSYLCRELLEGVSHNNSAVPEKRTAQYYKKRPCEQIIRNAAELLEAYLEENKSHT